MEFRSNDGSIAIKSRRLGITHRKAGSAVPPNVAPNGPSRAIRWLREKPVQVFKIPLVTKR